MFTNQNTSLLSLLKNIKWSSILDGTSKTLNVINQAIPVVYQVNPIINNANTMFKIANIMNSPTEEEIKKEEKTNNSPIFYI